MLSPDLFVFELLQQQYCLLLLKLLQTKGTFFVSFLFCFLFIEYFAEIFCSRMGLVCKLYGSENGIFIFKRELLFHSVAQQQEQTQL